MSIAEKLTTVAENMPKVYEAGQQSEYDRFWDIYQDNGKRDGYRYGFAGNGWTEEIFKPKYDLKPYDANGMFRGSYIVNLKERLETCGVVLDLSECVSFSDGFNSCPKLKVLPKLDGSAMPGTTNMCYNCTELETIEELKCAEKTGFNNTFYKCSKLTNMIVTGVIGQNGLDLHWSTKLTHDSLMSIINALQTKTSGTWTVTLGSENLAKLTDAEKAIATQKGWSLV